MQRGEDGGWTHAALMCVTTLMENQTGANAGVECMRNPARGTWASKSIRCWESQARKVMHGMN